MTGKPILIAALAALAFPAAALAQDAAAGRSQDADYHMAQQLALAERAASGEWQSLPGGILWRRVDGDGMGDKPTVADTVTVHYAGTFTDGSGFDSSYERGEPATFPLGRLIPAWQAAIPQMAVGDTIEIAAPAMQAYGPNGRGEIPGGATLLFTVELIGIGG